MIKIRTAIVFFAYINRDKNWKKIIKGQLSDLKLSGVLDNSDLFIEVSDSSALADTHEFFASLPYRIKNLSVHNKNTYEYYGLHKVWEIANTDRYDYIAYFHTKGMSYKKRFTLGSGRIAREIVLTYLTFKNSARTLEVFDRNEQVVRIGAFPKKDDDSSDVSGCFIWFNFFWIRASYAKTLEEPVITDNRFYYENWSSKDIGERGDSYRRLTYSLYSGSHTGYTIHEASDILKKLNRLYKLLWPFSALYVKYRYLRQRKNS
ncbi:MAG: hypothetical protein ACI4UM_02830 [Succinivibrio sp.]